MAAMTQILKTGILYFAFVFGVGFVLGSIRVLWAVPHFGVRMAELMEEDAHHVLGHYCRSTLVGSTSRCAIYTV